jgi:ABC-2 type transport system permease protein
MTAAGTPYDPAELATVSGYRRDRFLGLTMTLAVAEFKLRYYGNALGYFWTLAKPLLLFGVLYVAFTEVIRFGGSVPHYPVYLLSAIVLYNYFSEATSKGVRSLVEREALLRKMPMPVIVIPLAISLTSLFNLLLELVAVAFFILLSGIAVTWDWLQVIPLLVLLVIFTTAVTSLLANLYVSFRDTAAIWEVGLQLFFWATPIVYTILSVGSGLRPWIMLNPLAVIITQVRHAVIDPSAPSAAAAIGDPALLLIPMALIAATVALSVGLHHRVAPRVIERL